jgi:hypothetical protein
MHLRRWPEKSPFYISAEGVRQTEDFGRFTTLRAMAFDFEGAVPILQ